MRLRELQVWMQERIAGPNQLPATAVVTEAETAAVVKPSTRLTTAQRLTIYTEIYAVRLFEVMGDDFPTTRRLAGDGQWSDIVRGYLTAYPSRSWTLNQLGSHFAVYLAARDDLPRHALLADVARIERAMTEVFDAPDGPVLTAEQVAAVAPDAWTEAVLEPQRAFQLHAFDFAVNPILSAVREDTPMPPLDPSPSWAAIYRKDLRSWRRNLTEPMFAALRALALGKPIPAALESAAAAWDGPDEALEGAVFAWFQEWIAEGLFARVRLPGERPPAE